VDVKLERPSAALAGVALPNANDRRRLVAKLVNGRLQSAVRLYTPRAKAVCVQVLSAYEINELERVAKHLATTSRVLAESLGKLSAR
jgi:hypothetical protein